jgi:hypothetical protein
MTLLLRVLRGAVDAGGLVREGEAARRGLPEAKTIVLPPWLSQSGLGGVAGVRTTSASSSGVEGVVFPSPKLFH